MIRRVAFCQQHGSILVGAAHSLGCSSDPEVRAFIADCLEAGLYHELLSPGDCPVCSFLDPDVAIADAVLAAVAYRERLNTPRLN